jgi:hypothetical protein
MGGWSLPLTHSLMDPKLKGGPPHGPRRPFEVVHKNWVSEDYLKLKKGPFFIKILAEFTGWSKITCALIFLNLMHLISYKINKQTINYI